MFSKSREVSLLIFPGPCDFLIYFRVFVALGHAIQLVENLCLLDTVVDFSCPGNNYSFENDYGHSATIFFTQGCIPLDGEGNVDTTVTAPPLPDPSMLQAPSTSSEKASEKPDKSEQPSKKRGRPKQK